MRPCFGIACPSHSQCTHYHAVESQGVTSAIASCETWDHRYPMFELLPAKHHQESIVDSEGGEI